MQSQLAQRQIQSRIPRQQVTTLDIQNQQVQDMQVQNERNRAPLTTTEIVMIKGLTQRAISTMNKDFKTPPANRTAKEIIKNGPPPGSKAKLQTLQTLKKILGEKRQIALEGQNAGDVALLDSQMSTIERPIAIYNQAVKTYNLAREKSGYAKQLYTPGADINNISLQNLRDDWLQAQGRQGAKTQALREYARKMNQDGDRGIQATFPINKDYLSLYPNWIVGHTKNKAKQESRLTRQLNAARGAVPEEDEIYMGMNKLDPDHYFFQNQKWQGTGVSKDSNKAIKRIAGIQKKYNNNSLLLKTQLNADEAQNEVPSLIRDIVKANRNLGTAGFGKIAPKSSDLYAGRWLDQATGNIRVLPQANLKYVNRLNKNSKLGYLQAKIINHWNQLISTNEQYVKLQQQQDYQQKALKRLGSKFDLQILIPRYSKNIASTIKRYLTGLMQKGSAKYFIMSVWPQEAWTALYQLSGDQAGLQMSAAMKKQITVWQQMVTKSYLVLTQEDIVQANAAADDLQKRRAAQANPAARGRLTENATMIIPAAQATIKATNLQKLTQAYVSMTSGITASILSGIKQIKTNEMVKNLNYDQIEQDIQAYETDMQKLKVTILGAGRMPPKALAQRLYDTYQSIVNSNGNMDILNQEAYGIEQAASRSKDPVQSRYFQALNKLNIKSARQKTKGKSNQMLMDRLAQGKVGMTQFNQILQDVNQRA